MDLGFGKASERAALAALFGDDGRAQRALRGPFPWLKAATLLTVWKRLLVGRLVMDVH